MTNFSTSCYGPNFGQGIHWKHLQEDNRYQRVISLCLNPVTNWVDFQIDKKKFCEETGCSTQQFGDENGCLVLVLPYLRVFCQQNCMGNVILYLNCCSDYNLSEEETFHAFVVDFENFIETCLVRMGFKPVFQKNFESKYELYNNTIRVLADLDDDRKMVKMRQYGERKLSSLSLVVGMQNLFIDSIDDNGVTFSTQNREPVANLKDQMTLCAIEKSMAVDLEAVPFSALPLSPLKKCRWSTLIRLDPIKVFDRVARCRWNCLGFNEMEKTEEIEGIID